MQVVQVGNEVAWMNQGKQHRGNVHAVVPAGESVTQYARPEVAAKLAPTARYARVVVESVENDRIKIYAPPLTTVQKGLTEAHIYQELNIFDKVKNQISTVKNDMVEKMKLERKQAAAVERAKEALAKAQRSLSETRVEIERLRHRAECFVNPTKAHEGPAPIPFPTKARAPRGGHPEWLDEFIGQTFSFQDIVKRYPEMQGTQNMYTTVYNQVKAGRLDNIGNPGQPRFKFNDEYLIRILPASS